MKSKATILLEIIKATLSEEDHATIYRDALHLTDDDKTMLDYINEALKEGE